MLKPKPSDLSRYFWLLDYDGSMCPHREEWEFGHYDPQALCQILDALSQKSAGLMWNTGRSVASLTAQSQSFLKHPGFFEHGAFFWDGSIMHDLINEGLPKEIIENVKAWAATRSDWLRLEFKSHSLRIIPLHAQDRSRLRAEFLSSALHALTLNSKEVYSSEGWRAYELLLSKAKKSNAVPYLQQHNKEFPKSVPIMVGDDLADGGIAREVLALGGHAFLVGNHCGWIAEIPHKASQVSVFATPQDLLSYLQEVIERGELFFDHNKTKIPHATLVS